MTHVRNRRMAKTPGIGTIVITAVAGLTLIVGCTTPTGSDSTSPPSGSGKPSAALSSSPSDPATGENVSLDASASGDSDGTISSFKWDLDGDGSVERTTPGPTTSTSFASATWSYSTAGEVTAIVTVVDDDGATARASTAIQVQN